MAANGRTSPVETASSAINATNWLMNFSAVEGGTWRTRTLRHSLIQQTLTSRITAFERPRHFRDSMVRGAFKRFDHDHYFTTYDAGGTVMHDVFDYAAPLGGSAGWWNIYS